MAKLKNYDDDAEVMRLLKEYDAEQLAALEDQKHALAATVVFRNHDRLQKLAAMGYALSDDGQTVNIAGPKELN